MSYQIFISYRREGGDSLAMLFYDRLHALGFDVFFDVETLRSGPFNKRLFSVIDECSDVIVILPQNGLDRCMNDEKDWLRQEIAHAITKNKNIVPIMMKGFEWPLSLPQNMEELPYFNGVSANMEFFDAVINKVCAMLVCKATEQNNNKVPRGKSFLSLFKKKAQPKKTDLINQDKPAIEKVAAKQEIVEKVAPEQQKVLPKSAEKNETAATISTQPEVQKSETPKPDGQLSKENITILDKTETYAVLNENTKVGDIVLFGKYKQDASAEDVKQDIEWRVLDKAGNQVLLISKYCLDCRPYHEKREKITWEGCTLRSWLNDKFLNEAFSSIEQVSIILTRLNNSNNPRRNTSGGKETSDKVFLLSIDEAERYFVDNAARATTITESVKNKSISLSYYSWWLRSPGNTQYSAAGVNYAGDFYNNGSFVDNYDYTVRPVLWVKLSSDTVNQEGIFNNQVSLEAPPDTKTTTTSVTNSAETKSVPPDAKDRAVIDLKKAKPGEVVYFGSYPQSNENKKEPIAWKVLTIENGKALLLSDKILDCKQYNNEQTEITWEKCSLRKWLNSDFFSAAFTLAEQQKIALEMLKNGDNPRFGTKGGKDTNDKLFLLSWSDVTNSDYGFYASHLCGGEDRQAQGSYFAKSKGGLYVYANSSPPGNSSWWLRTPGKDQGDACLVREDGYISHTFANLISIGVRPALWVNLSTDTVCQEESPEKQISIEASPKMETSPTSESNKTDTESVSPDAKEREVVELGKAKPGDIVCFGRYPQSNENEKEPIAWKVLTVENGKALLLSEKILDCKPYNVDDKDITWETCTIRSWLNNDFYSAAFTAKEQAKIETNSVVNENNPWYGTAGGNNTNNKLFLLSCSEAMNPAFGFSSSVCSDTARVAQGTDYAKSRRLYVYRENNIWWLRTPGSSQYYACYVNFDGTVYNHYYSVSSTTVGVRPALWLNL